MADIPGVNQAYEWESPGVPASAFIDGAPWSVDWRSLYPIAPDQIHNHDQPAYLGALDATESVNDWNPWEGSTGAHYYGAGNAPGEPGVIRYGYGPRGLQEHRQAAPLAIDQFDRHPDHAQVQLSGVSSIAALVPFLELPDAGIGTNDLGAQGVYPYHFDTGAQLDMAGAIGPRQIFREPPSYGDQSAAVYAAGL